MQRSIEKAGGSTRDREVHSGGAFSRAPRSSQLYDSSLAWLCLTNESLLKLSPSGRALKACPACCPAGLWGWSNGLHQRVHLLHSVLSHTSVFAAFTDDIDIMSTSDNRAHSVGAQSDRASSYQPSTIHKGVERSGVDTPASLSSSLSSHESVSERPHGQLPPPVP